MDKRNIWHKLILGITIIILLLLLVSLTGCNRQFFDTQYKFDHIYIFEKNETYEVKSWRDFEDGDQIQVTLEDGTVLLLHSSSCILYKGDDNYFESKK